MAQCWGFSLNWCWGSLSVSTPLNSEQGILGPPLISSCVGALSMVPALVEAGRQADYLERGASGCVSG